MKPLQPHNHDAAQLGIPGIGETRAVSRRSDPETSHAAAARVDTSRLAALIVGAMQMIGHSTTGEIAEHLGYPRDSISPRMKPLVRSGKVEPTTERRQNPSGRSAIVWALVR